MIGGNAARDWAYGSLAVEKGPRHVHFPEVGAGGSREIDDEFFTQMTTERPKVVKGALLWDKPHKPREVGVCWVYAYAAFCGLQALSARFVALGKVPDIDPMAKETGPEALTVQKQPGPQAAISKREQPSFTTSRIDLSHLADRDDPAPAASKPRGAARTKRRPVVAVDFSAQIAAIQTAIAAGTTKRQLRRKERPRTAPSLR